MRFWQKELITKLPSLLMEKSMPMQSLWQQVYMRWPLPESETMKAPPER